MKRRQVALSLVVVWMAGCASALPKLNVGAPIQIENGALGDRYRQQGAIIDPVDMVDKLGKEPAAAPDIGTASSYGTVAMLLGAVGGALVGWPIGGALAGDSSPPWFLAAIGGGLIVVSIPFAIGSGRATHRAVDAHNQALGGTTP